MRNERATWRSPSAATSVTWVARTGPDRGMAGVTIDGTNKGTVDLYAASAGAVSVVYPGLKSARHTIVVKVLGTKRAASTGTSVTIDAFSAGSVVADDRDPGIRYGSWVSTTQAAATDGTYRSTSAKGATASVTFSGTSIEWITARARGHGQASVTIDGVSKGIVDLYASTTNFRTVVPYAGLSAGTHTLVITVLGTKNVAASGTKVVIDGFVVHP